MNILRKIFERPYEWKLNGHDTTDQWKSLRVGDRVEYAMTVTEDVLYTIEEIFQESQEAKIRRYKADGSKAEAYTVSLVMLRPVDKKTDKKGASR